MRFNADGLVPAVVQDHRSGDILMLAWMNREALAKTLAGGYACYWSRSRRRLWRKGETSGNTQKLVALLWDCDQDTLLLRVEQKGGACHLGRRSCFVPAESDGAVDVDNNGSDTGDGDDNGDAASVTVTVAADGDGDNDGDGDGPGNVNVSDNDGDGDSPVNVNVNDNDDDGDGDSPGSNSGRQ